MWKRRHAYLISFVVAGIAILPWDYCNLVCLKTREISFLTHSNAWRRAYMIAIRRCASLRRRESLAALGQWPWPRTRLVELVTRLRDLGAAAIAFDFIFAEPDRSSFENVLQSIPDGGREMN